MMIPYKWKFWKRKKPMARPRPEPAELTLDVAITGYDEFTEKLQKMEKAIEVFGAACARAGEGLSDVCERVEIITNYHITTIEPGDG